MINKKHKLSCLLQLVALFLMQLGPAYANKGVEYECLVKAVAFTSEAGLIKDGSKDLLLSKYLGTRFTVNSQTGEIKGDVISNSNLGSTFENTIIDRGSYQRGQSLKILSVARPVPSILYVQINDYPPAAPRQGIEVPFSSFRWQEFLSGVCNKH
jgi:hypothetical protein